MRPDLHLVDEALIAGWARPRGPRTVRLLDADPELGAGIPAHELALATQHLCTPVAELPVGPWDPRRGPDLAGALGVLVVRGVILRQVRVGTREAAELIGPGEILRPLDADDGLDAPVPFSTDWHVVQAAEIMVLDDRFAMVAGRWPSVLSTVFARMTSRARSGTVLLALAQVNGLELRLQGLLWHLADRFGRVERDGVVIPLRLTHQTLARLAAAQRPPVSSALGRLRRSGHVGRRPGGCWVLHGSPPSELSATLSAPAAASS